MVVLEVLIVGSVLAAFASALVCSVVASYCWFNAPRHAKPGAGDRFMKVGLWTNLTPEGNRLYRKGFVFSLGCIASVATAAGLMQLAKLLFTS